MSQERRAASELQARLRAGDFVCTAEITPPVSTDPAEFLKRALPLKGLATAVNVTDGAGAKVHLSSLAAAHFLVSRSIDAGCDEKPHRDKFDFIGPSVIGHLKSGEHFRARRSRAQFEASK